MIGGHRRLTNGAARALVLGAVTALAACSGGCYLFHGRAGGEADAGSRGRDAGLSRPRPVRDAGPLPDAGRRAPPIPDASLPPTFDGGPLPDPEPDVDPGERPSDSPDAGSWRDPPAPGDDVCCDVGEVVGVDDPERQASPPVVAWNGGEWGIAWRDTAGPESPAWAPRTVFRRLDRDARPASPIRPLEGFATMPADLSWGNGRYALLTEGPLFEGPGMLAVLDALGTPRAVTWVPDSDESGVVERFPAAHAWAVVTHLDLDGGAHGHARLLLFDDELARLEPSRELGTIVYADWRAVAVVELKSRLAVVRGTPDGVRAQVFVGRELDEEEGAGALVWPGTYLEHRSSREGDHDERVASALGATRLRDTIIAAYMNRREVATLVLDPFGGGLLHGPTPVASSPEHRNPGLAGDDVTGVTGICYPHGTGPLGGPSTIDADSIRFVAVGPDGRAIGAPVTIASGLRYVASCDVSVAGPGEFVVVWWNAARGLEPRHSILAATVRLRL